MKKSSFISELVTFCELEGNNINFSTQLNSLIGYDSLAIMTMIAFIDENFQVKLNAEQFKSITDFNSLIKLIGEDKFENE